MKNLGYYLTLSKQKRSVPEEVADGWEKWVADPVVKYPLAPRHARALLEVVGRKVQAGADANRLIDLFLMLSRSVYGSFVGEDLKTFQDELGAWGDETFPDGTPETIVNHLCREVLELVEKHEPEEAADCFLLLLHHAHRSGYDLLEEAKKKFEINKTRKWGKPDKYGVIEHIREED